jgi:FMN-dependent NADH-azoreductase
MWHSAHSFVQGATFMHNPGDWDADSPSPTTPATTWATAVSASRTPEDQRTREQRAAVALAATLADELIAADALLFAVPLYNFGVSQHFKTWVDMVITDPRLAAGTQPILAGKPAVLVTVRGGNYRAGTLARDGITQPGGCAASSPTSGTLT